jgi:ABC-type transport system substrate-binding protein
MAYNAWWVLGPDPDDSWNLACDQIPPVGQNMYFWCNARADAAMHDALATFDIERRKHDYSVVQHEMLRDLPLLPLWQVRRPDAYTPSLKGVSPSPAGSTFWNAWSWELN